MLWGMGMGIIMFEEGGGRKGFSGGYTYIYTYISFFWTDG